MTNNPNSISSIESNRNTSKSSKFVENTKRAVRKVLATTGIVAGSMLPINTSTALPVSANKIIHIEPTTSTTIKTVGQGTTADLLTAFNEKDNEVSNQGTLKNNIEETKQSETDVTENGSIADTEANSSTINSLRYNAIEIRNINPEDLMPKVEIGDKNVYKHIEHLRIPESTVITDMMWKYGAGNYSAEEYQNLMMRLNTGMLGEVPLGYNNYGTIGVDIGDEGSNHAHKEWSILNSLLNHTNLKVAFFSNRRKNIETFIEENDNAILIFGCSAYPQEDKSIFDTRPENSKVRELCKSGKLIIFKSGGNIYEAASGILKNKSYQKDVDGDEHGIYSLQANANGKNDSNASIALFATVGTDKDGDINQTNEIYESSMFPVGFHDKVLFSGRAFPYHSLTSGKIEAEGNGNNGKYATSFTNYFNVAIASILFQMKADTPDVPELLEMIRSTALTDYIRFDLNGDGDTDDIHDGQPETQPLLLMNPAGFFQKYLMPTSLSVNLKTNETAPLEKGYYHGVVYQIPGAEVNINGQWIPFTGENKELIFSQNPMNLEWRLNGETLNNYNYKPGDTISGQIIAVNDQWNGLNITKDFSINVENASSIDSVTMSHTPNTWYSIDGIRLNEKPTKPGIYIVNGQKVIIK